MMQRYKFQVVPQFLGTDAAHVRSLKLGVLNRDRSLPHLGRKFYHFLMGIICFSLYAFFLTREEALLALAVIGGSFVVLDIIRLQSSWVNEVALRLFGKLMRREELKSVSGNSFYVLGLLTIVLFFPKPIVLLSILFLAIGDPVAAVFGTLYGKHKIIGKKSLEGSAANFLFSTVASILFGVFYLHLAGTSLLWLGVLGGLVSVAAELFPAPVDDNFSIPVFSSLLISAIQSVFQIL